MTPQCDAFLQRAPRVGQPPPRGGRAEPGEKWCRLRHPLSHDGKVREAGWYSSRLFSDRGLDRGVHLGFSHLDSAAQGCGSVKTGFDFVDLEN
jgi:hypothetical protein